MAEEDLLARIARLEARVQELEDERAIRELLARYGFNADCCRDEAYVDLYADDGAIEVSAGPNTFRCEGKEQIRAFIKDPDGHSSPGFYGKAMHLQGNNVVVHLRGDEATVNSYSVVFKGDESMTPTLLTAGNNQWALRKVEGEWLIVERRRRNVGDPRYPGNLDATPA
jgi:hypothetical protein